MKAYVFPGQGAQFTGMGKDLYESCISKGLI
jgi:[acyl-carrier-protein] S-malonyltransferase